VAEIDNAGHDNSAAFRALAGWVLVCMYVCMASVLCAVSARGFRSMLHVHGACGLLVAGRNRALIPPPPVLTSHIKTQTHDWLAGWLADRLTHSLTRSLTDVRRYIGVFSKPANTARGEGNKPEAISMTAPVIMPQGKYKQ